MIPDPNQISSFNKDGRAMPAAKLPKGDRPDDVLDEARDLLRTVRMVLESADTGLDADDCCTLGYVMSQALDKLGRVHSVLSDGVLSTWDAATPKGKMVIPEYVPEASA